MRAQVARGPVLELQDRADLVQLAREPQDQADLVQLVEQDSAHQDQVVLRVLAHQPAEHQGDQDLLVEQAAVPVPQEPLVRAVLRTRPGSQSAPREKNSSKDLLLALVVLLFQEETATPL